MLRKLGFFAIAIALAPSLIACGDDGDAGGDPTLAAVFPETGFAGRTTRVQITADNASWVAPTVSFGDGVTVGNVEVVTPNAIFADVTVDATAAFGARTVTVTDGDAVTLADAFTVESPLEIEVIGMLTQGSIAQIVIKNKDIDTPFDTTSMGDGIFEPLVFVGVELTSPDGVDLTTNIVDVSEYSITTIATIDVAAIAGRFSVKSGLTMPEQFDSPGPNLDVTPRTAMPAAPNTEVTGMITEAFGTALYELTPAQASSLLIGQIASDVEDSGVSIALLGASGSFTEFLGFSDLIASKIGEKAYLIIWDNAGTPSYTYNFSTDVKALTSAAEAASNDTGATAQMAGALPFEMTGATLSSETDVDWVKFTVTEADVGKTLVVFTQSDDPETDTVVQFAQGNNGSQPFGEPSSDFGYLDSLQSKPITAAGTYYLKVTASEFFEPQHNTYSALVFVF